ncbi:MAG TPA: exosortase family protein XrtF [Bacteroidetes bacterium]|nr:exosortase family protein XrtF [Bacteroidota bacterium]
MVRSLRLFLFNTSLVIKSILLENKKVVFFLLRFLLVFAGFSLLYASWVDSYGDKADPFSWWIGHQLVGLFGESVLSLENVAERPAVLVNYLGSPAVELFEGCNGVAVAILFFAFVFAFKGRWSDLLWFVPAGLVVIHAFNLLRLSLLIHLSHNNSTLFHFLHKYLFTLIIYAAVFLLWVLWVRLALNRNKHAQAQS